MLPKYHSDQAIDFRDRKNARLPWLSVACWGSAAILVILVVIGKPLIPEVHSLGIGFQIAAPALGVWVALVIVWWTRRTGRFDPFELPVWFSVNAYVQTVLNLWLFQGDARPVSPWLKSNYGDMAVWSILLIGVGISALWLGYVWASRRLEHRPSIPQPITVSPRLLVVRIVWFGTFSITVLSVVGGARGYLPSQVMSQNLLLFVDQIGSLVTFILMLYHFGHPTRMGWMWLGFVCIAQVSLGLVVGTKGAVFIFLYVLIAAYYATKKLRWSWIVLGILLVLFVVPLVSVFRENLFQAGFSRDAGAGISERSSVLMESIPQVLSRPLASQWEQTRDVMTQRQGSLFEATAAVMVVHPRYIPYFGLDMLAQIIEQVVPRFLWPSKSIGTPRLYMNSSAYLGASAEYSFTAIGQFADAYRTGSWFFVVLWLGGIGVLSAWIYMNGPGLGHVPRTAFYMVMATTILTYSNDILITSVRSLQIMIPAWLIMEYLLVRRVHNRKTTQPKSSA